MVSITVSLSTLLLLGLVSGQEESDRCADVRCPPEPYNRTCKAIKVLGDCCATHFCDAGEPDSCKTSRLQPDCVNPPPGKENCTAFRDPYGCCYMFQCPADEKAGLCPRERVIQQVSQKGAFGRFLDSFVAGAKKTIQQITKGVKSTLEKHGGSVGRAVASVISVPFQPHIPITPRIRCTGDYTCPGTMKCCEPLQLHYAIARRSIRQHRSEGITRTTFHFFTKKHYRKRRSNRAIIDGVCVDPDVETIYPEITESPQPTVDGTSSSSSMTPDGALTEGTTSANSDGDTTVPHVATPGSTEPIAATDGVTDGSDPFTEQGTHTSTEAEIDDITSATTGRTGSSMPGSITDPSQVLPRDGITSNIPVPSAESSITTPTSSPVTAVVPEISASSDSLPESSKWTTTSIPQNISSPPTVTESEASTQNFPATTTLEEEIGTGTSTTHIVVTSTGKLSLITEEDMDTIVEA